MTSMLEKSDESYVFSRSDCISHFSPPLVFDISFGIEFGQISDLFLHPFWDVLRIKRDIKINADFHIDFYRNLTSFWLHLRSLWFPLGPFGVSLASLGVIWGAQWRPRSLPKWSLVSQGALDPTRTSFQMYLGLIFKGFWGIWDIPWDTFGGQ